jgi:hypothetical protein
MKALLTIFSLAFAAFVAWYVNAAWNEHQWNEAKRAGTALAYETYAREAPGRHQWKGIQALGELRWKEAQRDDTIAAYQAALASSIPYQARPEAEKRVRELRCELDRACACVLRGTGVPQASNAGNRLVLLSSDGNPHDWSKHLRKEWRPDALTQVGLVAVLDPPQETVLEIVPYQNGPSITRYACSQRVRLFRANDGLLLKEHVLEDIARNCQPSERYDLVRLGYPISFSAVESWLRPFVEAKGK